MTGRPRIEIDLKKVEEYAKVCSSEEQVARCLGIGYSTLTRYKKNNEQFREALKNGRAKADAYVASKLMEKIKAGDTASIIFYLKARCGWKETSRQEITGKDGGPVETSNAPDLSGISLEKLRAARELLYGETADKD